MIDVLLLAVVGLVTWCVAAEGFAGAAQICLIVIISGLLAMNFFEPLAGGLQSMMSGSMANWADFIALVGIFAVLIFLLRFLTEKVAPNFPDAPKIAYEGIRWFSAALTGYVAMAFLLTSLHTAPLPREFMGFKPERANFFGISAPDRQWLGFTQYVSETSFRRDEHHIFDGAQVSLGDPRSPYANSVWPSFPIRYATRRELIASAGATAPVSAEDVQKLRRTPATSTDSPSSSNNSSSPPPTSTGF